MQSRALRLVVGGLIGGALLAPRQAVLACTAFCAAGQGQVLVGNNEDWDNPRTKLWFVPAAPGAFGRMYVGFDDLWPQGGMNERGLWFDGFAARPVRVNPSGLPSFPGSVVDAAMSQCATVEEVVQLFSRYNRAFLSQSILMFADASGDAVSIEANAIVRKTGRQFVQTNFHQSLPALERPDDRFRTASAMLERAGDAISPDLFRRILAATHQNGAWPTQYSNVYDLRARTMRLYHFQDFEHAVTFDLAEELKKGAHTLDIPSLFPRKAAAEAFAASRPPPSRGVPFGLIAIGGVAAIAILTAAVFAVVRGGRKTRASLAGVVAVVVVLVVLLAGALRVHPHANGPWLEFAIGPPSGDSASIGPGVIRSNGLTVRGMLATAYEMPSVRVIGPPWLAETRYSLTAVVGIDEAEQFRAHLRRELEARFRLQTHVEPRPFDVFVLTASAAPRLTTSPRAGASTWFQPRVARLTFASPERIAAALEQIVGRPVLDETRLTGSYDLTLEWGDDAVASVTALLDERYGLTLAPARRDMDALIVDSIHRDPALLLLSEAGRLTRHAPPAIRNGVAQALSLR